MLPSEDELERLHEASARGEQGERLMDTDDDASVVSDVPNGKSATAAGSAANNAAAAGTPGGTSLPLTCERVEFLLDLMRDIGAYVESKDFELGLPITNFQRYHELWSMADETDDEEEEDGSSGGDEDASEYEDGEEEEEEE